MDDVDDESRIHLFRKVLHRRERGGEIRKLRDIIQLQFNIKCGRNAMMMETGCGEGGLEFHFNRSLKYDVNARTSYKIASVSRSNAKVIIISCLRIART